MRRPSLGLSPLWLSLLVTVLLTTPGTTGSSTTTDTTTTDTTTTESTTVASTETPTTTEPSTTQSTETITTTIPTSTSTDTSTTTAETTSTTETVTTSDTSTTTGPTSTSETTTILDTSTTTAETTSSTETTTSLDTSTTTAETTSSTETTTSLDTSTTTGITSTTEPITSISTSSTVGTTSSAVPTTTTVMSTTTVGTTSAPETTAYTSTYSTIGTTCCSCPVSTTESTTETTTSPYTTSDGSTTTSTSTESTSTAGQTCCACTTATSESTSTLGTSTTTSGMSSETTPMSTASTSSIDSTSISTTESVVTTSFGTTAVPTSTVGGTTSSDTTTAIPTSTAGATTTTIPASTASVTTSSDTTAIPTSTAGGTTSSDTTTAIPTSTAGGTTSSDTTTAIPTSTAGVTTTAIPTSTAEGTTSSDTTTAIPTATAGVTTTAIPTSTAGGTTTVIPTTSAANGTILSDTSTVGVTTTSSVVNTASTTAGTSGATSANGTTSSTDYNATSAIATTTVAGNGTTLSVNSSSPSSNTTSTVSSNATSPSSNTTSTVSSNATSPSSNTTTTVSLNATSTSPPASTTTTPRPTTTTTLQPTTTSIQCGGSLTGSGGVLQSPLFPANYPNNKDCLWTITANQGEVVRVSFTSFDLEEDWSCSRDWLEFYDGPSTGSRRLDRRCGYDIPLDLTSTGINMYVSFHSDSNNQRQGFSATWKSVCESTRVAWSGVIQSPANSGTAKDCVYMIEVNPTYFAKLIFTSFSMGTNCQNNYIEVRDGGYQAAPLIGTYCGSTKPADITASSNLLWVRYVTNGQGTNTFAASFTSERATCKASILTDPQGVITSPFYPGNYPDNYECTWTINAPVDNVIELTFESFQLEGPYYSDYYYYYYYYYSCPYDWVYIYDGDRTYGKYCATKGPSDTIRSKTNSLKVYFRTDFIVTYQGFKASYIYYNPKTDAKTRQYDLYPYGQTMGDTPLNRQKDDDTAEVYIKTGFPIGNTLQKYAYVGNKGLVTFDKADKGKDFKLKSHKMMICPYNADISGTRKAGTNYGNVFYQVHMKNKTILNKASLEIREFTNHKDYKASLVFLITWDGVPHTNSNNKSAEQATFQLALISNGQLSYALVYYKLGFMKWSVLSGEKIVIGVSKGDGSTYESEYSQTEAAFVSLDLLKGNTGRRGMWIYPLGDRYSPDQECTDWYNRNVELKSQRAAGFSRLPDCPCSLWFMWGGWTWAYYRNYYSTICYRMTVGNSRSVAPYGQECCYSITWWYWWMWGQYIADAPNAGSATAYNPVFWSDRANYQTEDQNAHDVCCYKTTSSEYCSMYYELRPISQCTTVIPFRFSWTWGDPHIKTLDEKEYTFNGWGEYILASVPSENFMLQCRTGLAITENGTVTNATVFTAFGARENDVSAFVQLDPSTNNTMIIFANGTDYTTAFLQAGNDTTLVENENITLKRKNESVVITFNSQIALTISIGFKSLDISTTMPMKFNGSTKGLLGNFNGNKDDDFILPNGTVLSPNLSERQIYEIFGPAWAVTADNTVMRYPPREGVADYRHPEFKPLFLDEQSNETRARANELCGSTNIACIYDFIATGSQTIASATKSTGQSADQQVLQSKNTIPDLTFNSTVIVTDGIATTINLSGYDPDANEVLTYKMNGNITTGLSLDPATGIVTMTINLNSPVQVSFSVVDKLNVSSSSRELTVIVCPNCTNGATCDTSRLVASNVSKSFLTAVCNCSSGWTGVDCSGDFNACDANPCSAVQTCTDNAPGAATPFNCSSCPSGYVADATDSARCLDIDECANKSLHTCQQICVNKVGSFVCACNATHRLKADGHSCEDINECAERTDNCDQTCTNTDSGMGYNCSCYTGYIAQDNGTCIADSSTAALCATNNCTQNCNSTGGCFCRAGYRINPNNPRDCVDINECESGVCSQSCTNTEGSFSCSCYAGSQLGDDQRSCQPCPSLRYGVDCRFTCNCNGRSTSCHPVTGCACQDGWSGSNCQDDVNECASGTACPAGQLCSNTNGSFTCTCQSGYSMNTARTCVDVNECESGSLNTCGALETCNNVPGSFNCRCKAGYGYVNNICTDVNECAGSNHGCEQVCTNTPGSYNCDCYYGSRLNADRRTCSNVTDVCASFEGLTCDHGCTLGADDIAVCFCKTGYKLASDKQKCIDVDECATGNGVCSQTCTNTAGGYYCTCNPGFRLDNDGKSCLACPSGTYGLNCNSTCGCGLGASRCDSVTGCVCNPGWTGISCSQDINECETASATLDCRNKNADCINTEGSYICRCPTGYQADTISVCRDIDECANSPCSQICENTVGSYRCLCNAGFSLNATTNQCQDQDECRFAALNKCTQDCVNTAGSYRCACTQAGFVLDNDGFTCKVETACNRTDCTTVNGGCNVNTCYCNKGYNLTNEVNCTKIVVDWCGSAMALCEQNCSAINDGDSYVCSCRDGFILNKDKSTCRECSQGTWGPSCNRTCSCNTRNSLSCNTVNGACTCKTGWNGTSCDSDINECLLPGSGNCPVNSRCENTDGSFVCTCNAGFYKSGNFCIACEKFLYGENCANQCNCGAHGVSCNAINGTCTCQGGWTGPSCSVDVNECSSNATHNCTGMNVICINIDGGFRCGCQPGYTYNETSMTCTDTDECYEGTSTCNLTSEVCNNTLGGFICSCAVGYVKSSTGVCTSLTRVGVQLELALAVTDDDVKNPYGARYAEWKRLARNALFDELNKTVPALKEVIVNRIWKGSLMIDATVIVNDIEVPSASSSLMTAMITISVSGLTFNGTVVNATVVMANITLSASTNKCTLYESTVGPCPAGKTCQVINNAATCSYPDDSSGPNVPLIVGLCVGLPLGVIAIIVIVIVALKLKKKSSGKGFFARVPLNSQGESYTKSQGSLTSLTSGKRFAGGRVSPAVQATTVRKTSWEQGGP